MSKPPDSQEILRRISSFATSSIQIINEFIRLINHRALIRIIGITSMRNAWFKSIEIIKEKTHSFIIPKLINILGKFR